MPTHRPQSPNAQILCRCTVRKFLRDRLRHNFLILTSFKGNAKACLIVEPLWGIPYNLYIAYTSLYMMALGCSAKQIGVIAAVGLTCEMLFASVGGVITDRLGRKRTSLIFDLIAWSIPTLLWAFAQGFEHFLIAAMINALVRIVVTSWTCLLIEDALPRRRVHIYTWIFVAGALAGFFAPIAGVIVDHAGLIPAVRGLYLFAFASMTTMFLLRNRLTHETAMGRQKMAAVKSMRLRDLVFEYKVVFGILKRKPAILLAFLVLILSSIQLIYGRTFLSILLKETLDFPIALISLVPALASAAKMIVLVFVLPGMSRLKPSKAIMYGFAISAAGVAVIAGSPIGRILPALIGVVLEAAGFAIILPFAESMLANALVDEHRAKILSLFHTVSNGIIAPFGYLGGVLTTASPRFPFLLVLGTLVLRFVLVKCTAKRINE
jgi:MFS transporter, DHA1 family, tetracycline resistance protein